MVIYLCSINFTYYVHDQSIHLKYQVLFPISVNRVEVITVSQTNT